MRKIIYTMLALAPLLVQAQSEEMALIDSLLKEMPRVQSDTDKIKRLDMISYTYSMVNPDQGIIYGNYAMRLAQNSDWRKGIAMSSSDLGINYEAKSEHAKALGYDLRALEIYRSLKMKSGQAGVLANLSLVYLEQGDYSHALESAFEAEKIDEALTDRSATAIIKEDIGIIYMEQGQYEKAAIYFSVALRMQQEKKNKSGEARISGNLGIIEDAKGNYAQALEYYFIALKANEASGNENAVQINLANIGNAYSHLKNYSRALASHFRALRISEAMGLKEAVATNKGNIGETYFFIASDTTRQIFPDSLVRNGREENLQQAIIYLEEAKNACAVVGYYAPMIEFGDFLSEAYYLSGDYKKAYTVFKENKKINDSIFSAEDNLKIKNLETRRELELKDKEIAIGNLKAEKNRDESYLLLAGIILLLMTTGLVLLTLMKRSARHKNIMSDIASIQSHQLRAPVARILGLARLFNMKEPEDPINKELIGHIACQTEELDEIVRKVVSKTIG